MSSKGSSSDAHVGVLKIGNLGLDVYEEESSLFFEDLSSEVLLDDTFARLMTFPNVLITGHQAFFTETALTTIAQVTIENISRFEAGLELPTKVLSSCPKLSAVRNPWDRARFRLIRASRDKATKNGSLPLGMGGGSRYTPSTVLHTMVAMQSTRGGTVRRR